MCDHKSEIMKSTNICAVAVLFVCCFTAAWTQVVHLDTAYTCYGECFVTSTNQSVVARALPFIVRERDIEFSVPVSMTRIGITLSFDHWILFNFHWKTICIFSFLIGFQLISKRAFSNNVESHINPFFRLNT